MLIASMNTLLVFSGVHDSPIVPRNFCIFACILESNFSMVLKEWRDSEIVTTQLIKCELRLFYSSKYCDLKFEKT